MDSTYFKSVRRSQSVMHYQATQVTNLFDPENMADTGPKKQEARKYLEENMTKKHLSDKLRIAITTDPHNGCPSPCILLLYWSFHFKSSHLISSYHSLPLSLLSFTSNCWFREALVVLNIKLNCVRQRLEQSRTFDSVENWVAHSIA